MSRLAYAAGRFAAGSRACVSRLAAWAAVWCKRGYRADLTGWRAALGPIVRAVFLAGAAAAGGLVVRARPWLMWVLTAWWLIAAWRASRPAPDGDAEDGPEEEPEHPSTEAGPDILRQLLADLIGDRPGVHLSAVLAHLQEHGQGEGWEVADLRARLEAQRVPVRRSVKVAGRVAYGVHRDDLQAPSPAEAADRTA